MSASILKSFDLKSFDFIDFEPSETLQSLAQLKLLRINNEAPSDSFIGASIKQTIEGFEAVLRIHSAVGTFVAEAISEDPQLALETMSRKIRSQLRMWKSTRFFGGEEAEPVV